MTRSTNAKNALFTGLFAALSLSACAAQQSPAPDTAPPDEPAPHASAAPAAQHAAAAPAAKKAARQSAVKKADKTEQTAKFSQTGKASWYGPGFHGKKTANGERFDMNTLTAAHRTLPISSRVRVTNLANGKSVVVRINDRGPYHGNRVMDLSKAAAQELGFIRTGTAQVKIEPLAPTDGKTISEQNRRSGIVTDAKKKAQTPI
nr:septal ring lytic transglycosylase RlpA family protein [Neisseria bacilliformis]